MAFLSLRDTPVSYCRIPALLAPLSVLGPFFLLGFSPIRIFQWSLSDGPWLRMSTSVAKRLCLFSAFGAYNPDNNNSLYNLTNTNKCKRSFDTTFINSRPLTGNHNQEEMDLSFTGCGYPDVVKFNQLWQLNLLDPKPVCIIEAICLPSPYSGIPSLCLVLATVWN